MIPSVILCVLVYVVLGLFFLIFDVMVLQTRLVLNSIVFTFYIILWPLIALMRLKDTFF